MNGTKRNNKTALKKTTSKLTKEEKNRLRKTVLSLAETKRAYWAAQAQLPLAGYSYAVNPLYNITKGSQPYDRVGDQIYINSIWWKLRFSGKAGAADREINWRIMVVEAQYQYGTLLAPDFFDWDTGVGVDIFYQGGTPSTDALLWHINTNGFNILHDEVVTVSPVGGGTEPIHLFKDIKIKLNKKFYYDAAGSGYGKMKNYYLIINGSYEGATVLDTLGNVSCTSFVSFKDM